MESDGLEWLLRLAVLWQQVAALPLRRTMQGGFFKRDAERLGQNPVLTGPPGDRLVEVPDETLAAVSDHPMTSRFRSPALCATGSARVNAAAAPGPVALVAWTNAGVCEAAAWKAAIC